MLDNFEDILKILKSILRDDPVRMVKNLQFFHTYSFTISINKSIITNLPYTNGEQAPAICFVCQNNWKKLPNKSIIYRAFHLIDKVKGINDPELIFKAISNELNKIPRIIQKFYLYDLLFQYGGISMSKVLETNKKALGIPSQREAIQDIEDEWVQDLSKEQLQALKPEQLQALTNEQIIKLLKKWIKINGNR